MAHPTYVFQRSNLAPEAPREVLHTVDGIQLRAEILEADSRYFKARIIEPCDLVIQSGSLKWLAVQFVVEGQPTPHLNQFVRREMERRFREWTSLEGEKLHFLDNRDDLEPIAIQAHREAGEAIRNLQGTVRGMQATGEALSVEFTHRRSELRMQFRTGAIDQTEYQSILKTLREEGPETAPWILLLPEVDRLNQQFRTQFGLLAETTRAFRQRAGLDLSHAASLLGLEELPLDEWLRRQPTDHLKGLSCEVDRLFWWMQ